MDERVRISLWLVSGGGVGVVLGGAFGALAGALASQSGSVTGTRFGRRMADVFLRSTERPASPARRGAITGAADGVLFLGIAGTLGGAAVAIVGQAHPRWLGVAALGSALLVGAAAFFGVLAYAMNRGIWAFLGVIAGGLLGSLLAGWMLGADRCLVGTMPGLLAGLVLSLLTRRYAPAFQPPQVGALPPRPRRDAPTDITRPDDSLRRPHAPDEE